MTAQEGREPEVEDVEEPDDPEELEEEEDDDEAVPAIAEEDGDEEASLEELLAQRAARRGGEEGEDETDIMSLAPEPEVAANEPLPTRVIPVKDRQEFVCNRCRLVKARVQLADEARGLCRDCV